MEQYLYMYIFFLIHIYAEICFLLKKILNIYCMVYENITWKTIFKIFLNNKYCYHNNCNKNKQYFLC